MRKIVVCEVNTEQANCNNPPAPSPQSRLGFQDPVPDRVKGGNLFEKTIYFEQVQGTIYKFFIKF